MVEIINYNPAKIQEEYDAAQIKLCEDRQKVDRYNKKLRYILCCVYVALAVSTAFSGYFLISKDMFDAFAGVLCTAMVIAVETLVFWAWYDINSDVYLEFNENKYPRFVYREFITEKNILSQQVIRDEMGTGYHLKVVAENKDTHVVETKSIHHFEIETRTDISHVTVDIENGKILLPYKQQKLLRKIKQSLEQ